MKTLFFLNVTFTVFFRLSKMSRCHLSSVFYFSSSSFLLQNISMFELGPSCYISPQALEFHSFLYPPLRHSPHAPKALPLGSLCVFFMPTPFTAPGDFSNYVDDSCNALGSQLLEFLTSNNFCSLPPQLIIQLFHQS